MVIVDNRLAFIGGLDLCYGRWDTHEHKLNDLQGDHLLYEMVPGQDYSNPRVKDFLNGKYITFFSFFFVLLVIIIFFIHLFFFYSDTT